MIRLKDLLFEQTKKIVKPAATAQAQPKKVMQQQHIDKGVDLANKLKQRGFSDAQAAAIVGNFWAESEFNSGVKGMGGAAGLMQWTGNRKQNLVNYAKKQGKDWTDEDLQLDFLKQELSDPWEKRQFDSGMAGKDVAAKAKGFYSKSERANAPDSIPDRVHGAQVIFQNLVTPTTPNPTTPASDAATTTPASDASTTKPTPTTPSATDNTKSADAAIDKPKTN